jgi:hypothetical protein
VLLEARKPKYICSTQELDGIGSGLDNLLDALSM